MKHLILWIWFAIIPLSTQAGMMQLKLTGTISSVSGTYMSTRAQVGDPFTIKAIFDSSLAPFGDFGGVYQYSFNTPFTFAVNTTAFSATSFIGSSLDNQVQSDPSSTVVDGYALQGSTTATAETSSLGFQVQLLSRDTNLVSSPPVSWLATTNPAVFDYARTFAISGNDLINPSPQNGIFIGGNITAISITPAAGNDFNGDGQSDLVWQNATTGDRGFWLMNGSSFGSWASLGNVATGWRIAATADFNGDGQADILWENTVSGQRGFWVMNGTAFASWVDLGVVATEWRIATAADFNSDGKSDILWENTATGQRAFWLMNGTAFASYVDMGVVATAWKIAAAGDFNGDGMSDILWENSSTGDRGFWLMNGTAFANWSSLGVVATEWHVAALGDFNGDGKADLVWENTATGDRAFWLMDGTAFASWAGLGVVPTEWHISN